MFAAGGGIGTVFWFERSFCDSVESDLAVIRVGVRGTACKDEADVTMKVHALGLGTQEPRDVHNSEPCTRRSGHCIEVAWWS